MDQLLEALKSEKVSVGVLLLLLPLMVTAHAWAVAQHNQLENRSQDRHKENDEKLVSKTEFEQLEQTVDAGFEAMTLNDASQEIRDIKLSLQVAEATSAPESVLARIRDELDHAVRYKECLRAREPNCEHLKEVE